MDIPNQKKILFFLHRYHILGYMQLFRRNISEKLILQFFLSVLVIILWHVNSFYKRDMHVASYFESSRLQIDHPKLKERSEKEEVVLERLAEENLLSNSEEFVEEMEFVPDPMDVENYVIEKVSASNANFQENTFPDASKKLDENIVFFFHLEKYFALENERSTCISIGFQDKVTF